MKEAEVMFAVAHTQPATASEISEFWGVERENMYTQIQSCWRQGLLVRRERSRTERTGHNNTYEYAIASEGTPDGMPRNIRGRL